MSNFHQSLVVARSSESAELYLPQYTGAIKALTLSSLLSSEEFRTSIVMDAMIGKMLLRGAMESPTLEHFDYLPSAEASIGEVFSHILNYKRNKVQFSVFDYSDR